MSDRFQFEIPGDPIPWARARHNGSRHWNPKRQSDHAKAVATYALAAKPKGFALMIGAIGMDVVCCFRQSKKCLKEHLPSRDGAMPWHPTRLRNDADNLLKQVADGIVGTLIAEDGEIVDGRCRKVCGPEPFTRVTIVAL